MRKGNKPWGDRGKIDDRWWERAVAKAGGSVVRRIEYSPEFYRKAQQIALLRSTAAKFEAELLAEHMKKFRTLNEP